MSTENANIPNTPAPFDYAAYSKAANEGKAPSQAEREAAAKPADPAAKPATPAAPAAAAGSEPPTPGKPAAKAEDGGDEAAGRLPRSARRELNRLRNLNGQLEGRLQMLMELGTKTPAAPAASKGTDPAAKPDRANFADDTSYLEAMVEYRVELLKAETKQQREAERADETEVEALKRNSAKYVEDIKAYPDWDTVVESMEDVELDQEAQQTFVGLVVHCEERARVMHYLGTHREELDAILAMPPHRQIRSFHQLEGRLLAQTAASPLQSQQAVTDSSKAGGQAKTVPGTGSSDAKKAKPSEAVAASGGQATDGKPGMLLADGKTLNPAWLAARNEAENVRR